MVIVKIAWEREEPSFMLVEDVTLLLMPLFSSLRHSCFELTSSPLRP
jgi:hypothetical protein